MSHLRPYLHPTYVDFPVLFHPNMSTVSKVTASAACDLTLGKDHELANCIWVLVATQGNGTPLYPDSFQEEDIVELCVGLDQVHPQGVLQLLDTEMVLTFWSSSEMLATMHLFTTAWHDESIRLCVYPPTSAQVREYMASRSRCPSGTQAPIQSEEGVPKLSPSEPLESWLQFHLALRDLDDVQLRHVMEELQQETARRERTTPPLGSPLGQW